jgi:hypothetical protein
MGRYFSQSAAEGQLAPTGSATTEWRANIAKNQNTYAKRQREMEKKVKAEQKRARRLQRKNGIPADVRADESDTPDGLENSEEEVATDAEKEVDLDPPA